MEITVSNKEMKFLNTLVNLLYAEPGFSDVDISDIAKEMKMRLPEVKGLMGSLVKKGLLEEPDSNFPGLIYLASCAYNLHERWMRESACGVKQVTVVEKA